jgi:hypothetical protein
VIKCMCPLRRLPEVDQPRLMLRLFVASIVTIPDCLEGWHSHYAYIPNLSEAAGRT